MAKKTFKIGEYAVGGIIAVEITGKVVQIRALDYYSKNVVSSGTTSITERNAKWLIDKYLNELTSSYYADKILTWIESNVGKMEYEF